jgi:glutaconate CoA-transferase, subunit B
MSGGTAAIRARDLYNPDLVLVYESGTIGAKPFHIPLSIGPGRIDIAFLGAAQIDRHANLNSTVIGPYQQPKTRLPDAGGAPEIAACCGEVVVVAPHSRRTFVERLGRGPSAVVTDLGVLEPDPESKELVLTQLVGR